MIIVRLPKGRRVKRLVSRFRKNLKRGLALGDVAYGSTSVYLIVPDEALSIAFAYGALKKAREEGLSVDFVYAMPIDPERVLPEEVKKAGSKLAKGRKLENKEETSLKNRFVTSDILGVLRK